MDTQEKGKVLLISLPEGKEREVVVQYLLNLFKNVPQEKVLALLKKTPVTLGKNIPALKAHKVIAELKKRGADAVFTPNHPAQAQPAPPQAQNQKTHPEPQPRQSPAPPVQRKEKTKNTNLRSAILGAFQGNVPRGKTSFFYKIGLVLVACAMLLLPLVYLALIGGVGYGLYFHATESLEVFKEVGNARAALFVYITPLVVGGLLLLFMVKPLFVKQAEAFNPRRIHRQDEPLLFAFVEKICEVVGAPVPEEIRIDTQVNASASLQHGIWSILSRDLVLTIGLPLTAGLDLHQFAGVLAHEFGHFAQTTGMRFSFLIQTINYWFARVVYQEDEWDWNIRQWSRRIDIRIAFVLWIARFFIWLTRQILKLLMYVAHAMSCFMSRQMEYDADRYEIHLVGANVFEQTFERMMLLSVAQQGMYQSLNDQWEERRLADNVAALVLAHETQIPEDLLKQIKTSGKEARTRLFDTHPADRDRIAASRKIETRKIFQVDASDELIQEKIQQAQKLASADVFTTAPPASVLFKDFEKFARSVSLDYYRNVLQQRINPDQLISVNDLVDSQDQEENYFKALHRFFQGQFNVLRPLDLELSPLQAPASPKETVQQIKTLRQAVQGKKSEQSRLLKTFHKQEERLIKIACAQALCNAGFRIDPKAFGLPSSDSATIEKAYNNTKKSQNQLIEKLRPFEQSIQERLSGALQLLAVPKALARLEEGERIKQETELCLQALTALEATFPLFNELTYLTQQLTILARQLQGNEESRQFISQLRATMDTVYDQLKGIKAELKKASYPFEHTQKNMNIGRFLLEHIPEKDNLGGLLDTCYNAIDKQQRLHARLAARLTHTAEQIENLVGLPPLPEPRTK